MPRAQRGTPPQELTQPIPAYKLDRSQIKAAQQLQQAVLFQYCGIDPTSPDAWKQLALTLAQMQFPGFMRVLSRPRGGRKPNKQSTYRLLFLSFERYRKARPNIRSQYQLALSYLKDKTNKDRLGELKITNCKAFLRAVKRGSVKPPSVRNSKLFWGRLLAEHDILGKRIRGLFRLPDAGMIKGFNPIERLNDPRLIGGSRTE